MVLSVLLARFFGLFQWFSVATNAQAPSIKKGDLVITSPLLQPKKNDIICFRNASGDHADQIWLFRLVATEGDTVEIKDGRLYVDHKDQDKKLNLMHIYRMSGKDVSSWKKTIGLRDEQLVSASGDSVDLVLHDAFFEDGIAKGRLLLMDRGIIEEDIREMYKGQLWNRDQFGPLVIPKGKWFVLGDNRHFSNDSRFIGPVDEKHLVGTVLLTF